jgi:hypothetical protein
MASGMTTRQHVCCRDAHPASTHRNDPGERRGCAELTSTLHHRPESHPGDISQALVPAVRQPVPERSTADGSDEDRAHDQVAGRLFTTTYLMKYSSITCSKSIDTQVNRKMISPKMKGLLPGSRPQALLQAGRFCCI